MTSLTGKLLCVYTVRMLYTYTFMQTFTEGFRGLIMIEATFPIGIAILVRLSLLVQLKGDLIRSHLYVHDVKQFAVRTGAGMDLHSACMHVAPLCSVACLKPLRVVLRAAGPWPG